MPLAGKKLQNLEMIQMATNLQNYKTADQDPAARNKTVKTPR